jgi:hypothetical protein
LSAENSCNLHAIITILFIFLHEYLVFVLCPSSKIYIIIGKLADATFSDPKGTRHRKQIAMTSN